MEPLDGVRFTLISDVSHAPYSGMLPGLIAGTYTWEEAHIDLRRLCEFAGVRFILGSVNGLDLEKRQVGIDGRSGGVRFDLLSINTGSTPAMADVPGAEEFAIPSKPVPQLLEAWEKIVAKPDSQPRITLVGGGAGGVELALSFDKRLGGKAKIRIVHSADQILESHNEGVGSKFEKILAERGIEVITSKRVVEVKADGVVLSDGEHLPSDHVFWVTRASPQTWPKEAGLEVTPEGFIHVSETLQSLSHPFVFAAGDLATIKGHLRPKSGVFAVRMAKPLFDNIRHLLLGEPLRRYRPQKEFLSLIGTAMETAIGSRRWLAWHSPLMWKLKDRIDRQFMRKFEDLPEMDPANPPTATSASGALAGVIAGLSEDANMRCLGCAAKVGSPILSNTLRRIRAELPHAARSLGKLDDAAELHIPNGATLLQTVDYMPALVDDPYLFGRITALHSFSDIFAMGAQAHSAVAAVLLPFAAPPAMEDDLFQTLAGILFELEKAGAQLAGGHTAEGQTLAVALTCNGVADEANVLHKQGAQPGDVLILTKPIGTGTLFAAHMRLKAQGRWIDGALESMLQSNLDAARVLAAHQCTACTDVTGFGLLGHLAEMFVDTGHGVELSLSRVPLLEGALDCVRAGIVSSLYANNATAAANIRNAIDFAGDPRFSLLFDPQTSGGLVATVPADQADECIAALEAINSVAAAKIGIVIESEGMPTVRLVK
jgi:selenide,water dikinase